MRYTHRLCLLALALAACDQAPVIEPPPVPVGPVVVTAVTEAAKPVISLPDPPALTTAGQNLLLSSGGRALVFEFETGGRAGYDPHPEWPEAASGVTVGIGYDCGYYSRLVILSDWQALRDYDRTRLGDTAGIRGIKAKPRAAALHDILVRWEIAVSVFDTVDVAREFSAARKAMPGFDDLRPNAQAALISLGFNRGWGMSGPNRVEMRAIRDLVPARDYEAIASQLRKMVRVWTGTKIENGMRRRRLAEAKLVETP